MEREEPSFDTSMKLVGWASARLPISCGASQTVGQRLPYGPDREPRVLGWTRYSQSS